MKEVTEEDDIIGGRTDGQCLVTLTFHTSPLHTTGVAFFGGTRQTPEYCRELSRAVGLKRKSNV